MLRSEQTQIHKIHNLCNLFHSISLLISVCALWNRLSKRTGETHTWSSNSEKVYRQQERGDHIIIPQPVGAVWPAYIWHVGSGEVFGGDGGSSVGHPHGVAVRNDEWRWDESSGYTQLTGRRLHLPLGNGKVRNQTVSLWNSGGLYIIITRSLQWKMLDPIWRLILYSQVLFYNSAA